MTLVLLVLGCTPQANDFVVREPDDTSYALGDVWRAAHDSCGREVPDNGSVQKGGFTIDNRYRTIAIRPVQVGPDCVETPPLALFDAEGLTDDATLNEESVEPMERSLIQTPLGYVIRMYDLDSGELLSAWELGFPGDANTVVLQP